MRRNVKTIYLKTRVFDDLCRLIIVCITLAGFMPLQSAYADKKQQKYYKRAFKEKAKCIYCHVDTKPKKEDDMHDLNDYGKQALAIDKKPKKETYLQLGPVDPAQYADVEYEEDESEDDDEESNK
jgi:hypothetical protein